jgi:BlaI family transcriptional regulator, penicillinase repressor
MMPESDMTSMSHLSRRERQIMDLIFARDEATVLQIAEALPDPPTPMAVRRMLHILVEKGHLRGRLRGREVIYSARASKKKAGASAFQRVLETFFDGSLEQALAVHLVSRTTVLSPEERSRLVQLIEQARKEGR